MQIVSAYLIAATAVEGGNYDEGYGVYEDLAFEEYMDEGDQSIVGDYIGLEAPTGGSQAGNFDGSKFCSDWFAAFVRPIEYMTIYGSRFGFSTAYPDPNDPSAWEHFATNQGGETQLIPEFLDDLVFDNTGKHINMWFAAISLEPWTGKGLGLTGVYIPRNVGFRLSGNYPTQGYGVFQLIDHSGELYIPSFTQYNWNFMSKSYNGTDFPENPAYIGANRKTNFILVYNVTAFKAYLNTIDRETFRAFDNALFALAECNIDKSRRPRTGS